MSDLHPHTAAWSALAQRSPTRSLAYVPASVDATNAPRELVAAGDGQGQAHPSGEAVGSKAARQMRTFFLAFHHFDEEGAVRVLADAMDKADAVGCVTNGGRASLYPALLTTLHCRRAPRPRTAFLSSKPSTPAPYSPSPSSASSPCSRRPSTSRSTR